MRIALLGLTFVWLVFISGIIYSLVTSQFPGLNGGSGSTAITSNVDALNETDRELIRNIQNLQDRIDLLETGKIWWVTADTTGTTTPTSTSTSLPSDFTRRIEPTITLKQIQNINIFSLSGVSYVPYTTYRDTQYGLVVYDIQISYEKFLGIMQTVPSTQYSMNEVKTFPFSAFYVNPPKADDRVRLVWKFWDHAIAMELAKDKYEILRALLVKTDAPAIPIRTGSTSTGSSVQ